MATHRGATWLRSHRSRPAGPGRSALGLRTRATIAFGLIGLFAATGLATSTYFVAPSYLLDQRQDSAEQQAFVNARLSRSAGSASGTGLGLALTVAHIGLHVGDLTVTDAPSGGARFVIRLPSGGVT